LSVFLCQHAAVRIPAVLVDLAEIWKLFDARQLRSNEFVQLNFPFETRYLHYPCIPEKGQDLPASGAIINKVRGKIHHGNGQGQHRCSA